MANEHEFPGIDVDVNACEALDTRQREQVRDLFARTYADASQDYLEQSMARLRFIATARRKGQLVGFALADTLHTEIPRIAEPQLTTLGGIGCIETEERRGGLFSHISQRAARGSGLLDQPFRRILAGGRMGHPAGFRSMNRNPTVIPREGVALSDWHLEVAEAIARLYGVTLETGTLVVRGSGRPIGTPNIRIEVSEDEWRPFAGVDRSRGDSLLAMAWSPEAPDGW